MQKKSYQLKMEPEVVNSLRLLALRLGYQRGEKCSWAQLTREGVDLILKKYANPNTPTTTNETAR